MYATPIKRTMQALYAAGLAGSLFLAVAHPEVPLKLPLHVA